MSSSVLSPRNPPLTCVIARVQFAPLKKMANYIPDLQEALRLTGFPEYETFETRSVHIDEQANAGTNVTVANEPCWNFANLDRTLSIRIDQQSVSLFFTDYHDLAEAKSTYRTVFETVGAKIPSLARQWLQLRYINHIPLTGVSNPSELVKTPVLGMPNIGDLERQASVTETYFQTPEGSQLLVRCTTLAGGLSLPADILPLKMKLRHPEVCNFPFILLENVHTKQAESPEFSSENCLIEISALRALISYSFRETVTPAALKSWI